MRHLNEIVRERNQYSRDAMEAWQDFINLKGRMDTELNKVSKRNNYLIEELESWKQQFLKFQAFADTLTKETQDLKVKIENHKRENRRLAGLIDQQKDDATRLSVRLAGTEKQRDDALEALVLQQEIAEELERERKRNRKELNALQHTNVTIVRQRDEARRVVLHLRSLISGQHHHMEHLVKTLTSPDELAAEIEAGFAAQEEAEAAQRKIPPYNSPRTRGICGPNVPLEGSGGNENDARFIKNLTLASRRLSTQTFIDVADRHLKDKTDAIAHIIRNIAEQCQAAVEGLQLAHDAELGRSETPTSRARESKSRRGSSLSVTPSDDGTVSATASDVGDDSTHHHLRPNSGRISSIPPTPDLIPNRSSTSMSIASTTATTPERSSQQYGLIGGLGHGDIPTKIVEDDEDDDVLLAGNRSESESEANPIPHPHPHQEPGVVGKHPESLIHRPSGARISALGSSR